MNQDNPTNNRFVSFTSIMIAFFIHCDKISIQRVDFFI